MTFPHRLCGLTLLCFSLLAPALPAADNLAGKIEALISAPDYKGSRWGILVVDAETGKPVYAHNADMLFAPASVTKLYSCAAALAELGPEHRFETPVYQRGEVVDGTLQGSLILVARGDLTLGGRTDPAGKLAFHDNDHTYANWLSTRAGVTDTDPLAGLKALARQVKAGGIRRIEGDVLIDDRLFPRARGTGSGPDVLSPIVVNDNLLDFLITPAEKAGAAAQVKIRPATNDYQVEAQVQTVGEGKKPAIRLEWTGPRRLKISGHIPAGSKPLVRILPVLDPAEFARLLFIQTLRREGVEVEIKPHKGPQEELPSAGEYGKLTRVAVFQSPPFSEAVKVILKVSHNLYASTLPLLLAVKHGKHTVPEGMRLERKVLAELGVPVETISLESGAGGGNGDHVTPRATVALLLALLKRPDFPVFKAALPVLGVDGTLADMVARDSLARGKVHAKTGTYTDADLLNDRVYLRSKALAGYMTTARGRPLVFAAFVNDVLLPKGVEPSREGKALGHLCEILYQDAP
jgi:D-alanyl-D-alanine carboxypeptidase/D-alanyl-D-alanine-endopeptidase (penicillin-binding protein 4)